MRIILTLSLICVALCVTADAQVNPVESHIIKGRLYRIFWETAVAVESEMCRQFIHREEKLPQKLYYYDGIYSFQQGDIQKARDCFWSAKTKFSPADIYSDLAELWIKGCDYKLEGTLPPFTQRKVRGDFIKEFEGKATLRPENKLRYMSELGYLLVLLEIEPNSKLCQDAYQQVGANGRAPLLNALRKNYGFAALRQGNLPIAQEIFAEIDQRTPEYRERFDEVKARDGSLVPITVEFFDPIILRHLSEYYFRQAQKMCFNPPFPTLAQEGEGGLKESLDKGYLLGVINRELGDIKDAISNFEHVLRNTQDEVQKLRARTQLGVCFYLLGEKERAETMWLEIREFNNPQVISELGKAYTNLGIHLQDAVRLLRQSRSLLRTLPENRKRPEWWFYENSEDFKQYTWNLVWAYFKSGQRQQALAELENVYLPNERHSLDVYDTEDERGMEYLSLLRHLNLAKLGKMYSELTRYSDMRYYIYLKDRMFPRPGYYPATFQIFQTLEHLILYKETQTPALVSSQPDIETLQLMEDERQLKERQASEDKKTPVALYVLILFSFIVIIGYSTYRFIKRKEGA